jgi:hypothetical protein
MSKIEWTKRPHTFVGLDEFCYPVFVPEIKTVTIGIKTKTIIKPKHLKTIKNGKF